MDVIARLATSLADRYVIERELGAGGMATVYLATDVRHHRKVALKVMRPELTMTLGSTRFLREIQTAAQLQHPHILPLHDSGEVDGFLYFVMPYVEGESLRTRLTREGELPVAEAVRLLRDVVDALAYAHSLGVVHRDVKPDNVLLSGRHAIVTDFGVAKAVSEATGRHALTTAGVALGTPTYMAPEQASADPHVDHRADIYAVGVVAYELLTGQPPFAATTAQQMLAAHLTQAPQPVTTRRTTVPPALDALILRCLEKKPADRWQSADELLAHLEGFVTPTGGTTPVSTQPVRVVPPSGAARWRRPAAIAALLGAVALLGTAGWLAARRASGPSDTPRVVVLPPRNLGPAEQSYVAEGIAEEINNRLVALQGIAVIGRSSAERYRTTTLAPREIGEQLSADYVLSLRIGTEGPSEARRIRVSAELVRAATDAQVWARSFQAEAAADYFRVQGEIAEQVAQGMGVTLVSLDRERIAERPTDNEEAYDYFLRGAGILRVGHTNVEYRDAIGYLERSVQLDSRFAMAWAALAEAHTELYWFWGDRTERRLGLARDALDRARALAPDAPATRYTAGVYYYHGQLDFPRALEEMEAAVRADPGRAAYHEFIGYVQRRAGRFEEALASMERARRLDPRGQRIISGVAETMVALGRQDEAVALGQRALELAPEDWVAQLTLLYGQIQRGDLAQAAEVVRRSLARPGIAQLVAERPALIGEMVWLLPPAERAPLTAFPPLSPDIADTAGYHLAKGDVLRATGGDARPSYEAAAAAYERRLRARPSEAWDHQGRSIAYRRLGRPADAVRSGQRAVQLLEGRDFYEGPLIHVTLAQAYLAAGQRSEAVGEFQKFVRAAPGYRLIARHHPDMADLRAVPEVRRLLGS